jgi:competence ComEA-like helix-hairpin-helix protein
MKHAPKNRIRRSTRTSTRPRLVSQRIVAALVAFAVAAVAWPAAAAAAPAGKVNINSADAEQLALLPRVGPSIAERIVDHREENGPFAALEDLMLVRGVGEKTFERMEPYLTLEGDTTLTEKVRSPRQPADDGQAADDDAR